jgi:hypothetical protein
MDTGLAKLEEASYSVEILKKDLAVMEQELAQASEKAEKVCMALYLCCFLVCCGFLNSELLSLPVLVSYPSFSYYSWVKYFFTLTYV